MYLLGGEFSWLGVVVVLVALYLGGCVHEYGHAWAATIRGDTTAKKLGRLTLNPIAHFDPFMSLIVPIVTALMGFPFGGMKPVPIAAHKMRNPQADLAFATAMGPIFQLLFAGACLLLALALSPVLVEPNELTNEHGSIAYHLLMSGFVVNIVIAAFNLIPIPPLDGSRILRFYIPGLRDLFNQLDQWGLLLVMAFIFLGGTRFLRQILVWGNNLWVDAMTLAG